MSPNTNSTFFDLFWDITFVPSFIIIYKWWLRCRFNYIDSLDCLFNRQVQEMQTKTIENFSCKESNLTKSKDKDMENWSFCRINLVYCTKFFLQHNFKEQEFRELAPHYPRCQRKFMPHLQPTPDRKNIGSAQSDRHIPSFSSGRNLSPALNC